MNLLHQSRQRVRSWFHRMGDYAANLQSSRETFTKIYRSNAWSGTDSVSGPGSDLGQTTVLREELPKLLRKLGVKTMLDAPCGDLNWIRDVNLDVEEYLGGDIVPQLVAENQARFRNEAFRKFIVIDMTVNTLPKVDLIFCRDCLVHLPFKEIRLALSNFVRSGSKYLLTTTFPATPENLEIRRGGWRPLNLSLPPFYLPTPEILINEKCQEQNGKYSDKSIGLWNLSSIQKISD